jgi:hypothetical protein
MIGTITAGLASLTANTNVGIDHGGPDEMVVYILLPDVHKYKDAPIFTEKPWLKFRNHPTNPRRRK